MFIESILNYWLSESKSRLKHHNIHVDAFNSVIMSYILLRTSETMWKASVIVLYLEGICSFAYGIDNEARYDFLFSTCPAEYGENTFSIVEH